MVSRSWLIVGLLAFFGASSVLGWAYHLGAKGKSEAVQAVRMEYEAKLKQAEATYEKLVADAVSAGASVDPVDHGDRERLCAGDAHCRRSKK